MCITISGMNITVIHQTTSGVILKMRRADSAFPRANLAICFVVSITNHRVDEVVHTPN
jgi:hypothetical protein